MSYREPTSNRATPVGRRPWWRKCHACKTSFRWEPHWKGLWSWLLRPEVRYICERCADTATKAAELLSAKPLRPPGGPPPPPPPVTGQLGYGVRVVEGAPDDLVTALKGWPLAPRPRIIPPPMSAAAADGLEVALSLAMAASPDNPALEIASDWVREYLLLYGDPRAPTPTTTISETGTATIRTTASPEGTP